MHLCLKACEYCQIGHGQWLLHPLALVDQHSLVLDLEPLLCILLCHTVLQTRGRRLDGKLWPALPCCLTRARVVQASLKPAAQKQIRWGQKVSYLNKQLILLRPTLSRNDTVRKQSSTPIQILDRP